MNRTFATWIGYTPAELLTMRLADLMSIASRIFYSTHFAPLVRMQGFFHEVALDLVTKDKRSLQVMTNATERRDAQNNPVVTRLIFLQAADRRSYEQQLLAARAASRDEAQTLEKMLLDERMTAELREQFIAVLGHDLRNPLGAINNGIYILGNEQLGERGLRTLAMMTGGVGRMTALIDNVLDFARGRLGGGLTIQRTRDATLEPYLRHVVDEIRSGAGDHRIEVDIDLPLPVDCDRSRIGQLLSNLLGNAVTHGSTEAPIRVSAKASENGFELSVSNAGEAIPDEAKAQLFQPFFRGAVRDSQQGLGLGLYIASEIARAHGGTLTVESSDEQTKFTFAMPD